MNLALNEDHDLDLTRGNLTLDEAEASLAQRVKCALLLVRGEWFLRPNDGVPYFEDIWKKNPDMGIVRAAFVDRILAVDGVAAIVQLETRFSSEERAYYLQFTVRGVDSVVASGALEVSL